MACESSAPTPAVPPSTPTPGSFSSGKCFADLSQVGAAARIFPEALLRDGTICTRSSYAEERHCPGVYVAIVQGDRLVLNTGRYFDGNRQLFAMWSSTDIPTYCNRTSSDIIYGTLPTCPGPEIVTNLCRR